MARGFDVRESIFVQRALATVVEFHRIALDSNLIASLCQWDAEEGILRPIKFRLVVAINRDVLIFFYINNNRGVVTRPGPRGNEMKWIGYRW